MELPPLLSPDEVAVLLHTKRGHVYALLARGCLPAVHVGRLLRIPVPAVTEFIANGGRRP